ncbi:MAG: DUF2782 domain-containing protein [Gammaproteobacteria bacterium]|nr:DUF2782 domain-containing protein [Gammaproteobacteria bacterium]
MIAVLVSTVMLAFVSARATEETEPPDLQPLPDAAPDIKDEGVPDAIQKELDTLVSSPNVVEEIRLRGRIYMLKVTPQGAPPYYLVDRDGDGNFDTRFNEFDRDQFDTKVTIPRWKIKTW